MPSAKTSRPKLAPVTLALTPPAPKLALTELPATSSTLAPREKPTVPETVKAEATDRLMDPENTACSPMAALSLKTKLLPSAVMVRGAVDRSKAALAEPKRSTNLKSRLLAVKDTPVTPVRDTPPMEPSAHNQPVSALRPSIHNSPTSASVKAMAG